MIETAKLPFGRILQEALHAGWTAMMRSPVPVALALVSGLAIAIALNAGHWTVDASGNAFAMLIRVEDVVLAYFALASAVRLVRPEYRMTLGDVIGVILYSIAVGVLSGIAALFLILPALYIYTKIGLAPYLRLLRDFNTNALEKAWIITNGYFWQSLGFLIGLTVLEMLVAAFGALIANGFLFASGWTAFATFPMACGMVLYAIFIRMTGYTYLASALLREHERRQQLRYVI